MPASPKRNRPYSSALSDLMTQAYKEVKDRLRAIGGSFTFKNTQALYINTCESFLTEDDLYILEAKKIMLEDGHLMILADLPKTREKQILEGEDGDDSPDEIWYEGGDWYAETEGLLELFDLLLDLTSAYRYRLIASRPSTVTDPEQLLYSFLKYGNHWDREDGEPIWEPETLGIEPGTETDHPYAANGDGLHASIYMREFVIISPLQD